MGLTPYEIRLGGGLNERSPSLYVPEGHLIAGTNIECKEVGGYRRLEGYTKYDAAQVTGGAATLTGVHIYNGEVYAFVDSVADSKMYSSAGSGWTLDHTFVGGAGGSYEFDNYNFGGTEKMYGVSGAHKAFQWDGTTLTLLTTGLTTDTPEHVVARRQRLWLSYSRSVLFSDLSDPTAWVGYGGLSGELGMGSQVNAMAILPGGDIGVWSEDVFSYIKGSAAAELTADALVEHGNRFGAFNGSVQRVHNSTIFADENGIGTLDATDAYGDFSDTKLSYLVENSYRTNRNNITCSCVVRSKSQYRVFFNDATGLIFTFGPQGLIGVTPLKFPDVVRCVASSKDSNGAELIVFGTDDGYVYKMEAGNNFGGDAIMASLRTAYTPLGNRRVEKQFKQAILDVKADSQVTLNVKPNYQFNALQPPDYTQVSVNPGESLLGSAVLGTAVLGASGLQQVRVDLPGAGEYVSLQMYTSSTTAAPWEIDGMIYEVVDLNKPGRRIS